MLPKPETDQVALPYGETLAIVIEHAPRGRAETWVRWRELIARFAGVPAAELRIARTAGGKPHLAEPCRLAFNVSHGARCSLIALSRSAEVGCDVEDRLVPEDPGRIGPAVLHPDEAVALALLEGPEKSAAFARMWARKEALLKAIGTGFGADPRSFDVRPTEPAAHVRFGTWFLHDAPQDGIAAAVATGDRACRWLKLQASSMPSI